MTSFLEQDWTWHFPSLLREHLQESDRPGTEVRGLDRQTQHSHLPLCCILDTRAGRETGLEGSHPTPLCSWVRDCFPAVFLREVHTDLSSGFYTKMPVVPLESHILEKRLAIFLYSTLLIT